MRSMPVRDGLSSPKPTIRISWEEWRYLMRAALLAPNLRTAVEIKNWLYDNAAWADDRILLPYPDDRIGHA